LQSNAAKTKPTTVMQTQKEKIGGGDFHTKSQMSDNNPESNQPAKQAQNSKSKQPHFNQAPQKRKCTTVTQSKQKEKFPFQIINF